MKALLHKAGVLCTHPAVALLYAFGVLTSALAFEALTGADPCTLCVYGRFPWGGIILGAMIAWFGLQRVWVPRVGGATSSAARIRSYWIYWVGICCIAGIGISAYHFSGELGFLALACAEKPPSMPLEIYIQNAVSCDIQTLGPFSIPLTIYNLGLYTALLLLVGIGTGLRAHSLRTHTKHTQQDISS